jgi:hypothetical protein
VPTQKTGVLNINDLETSNLPKLPLFIITLFRRKLHQLHCAPLAKAQTLAISVPNPEVFSAADVNFGIFSSIIDQISNRVAKKP